ncbi:MAG: LON peptidase substrate-binding domain-containing protein [Halioglobus sp.]
MTDLPLFPLGGVLLPHGRMALQVFEQRYLDLIRESLRNSEPFGIVWIRRGSEVAERGSVSPELGDFGTCAHIVDWDQLPNGLLGITVEGRERFELQDTSMRANGLVVGQVDVLPTPEPVRMREDWQSLLDVLRSLEAHPHVQRMNLDLDFNDAWQVGYGLTQLLPMEESLKYELLCIDEIDALMSELDTLLNQISGEG